ncbi:MAG TPA: GMC family oxidoreductase N-terminal domain-containing protein [Pseudonocardiaceae bacterium]|jgi:choline dehydrogenase|nr:GMC family oxidoreductase N-terminal domain-containing protein [Pseudonocardiaceae bacterium]
MGIAVRRFDYIVVGGGTAGCVLAARLSQDPATRVLLLEAGAAQPTAAMANPAAWFSLAGTSVDWAYQTVPQSGTDHAVHAWPRGKVLGGCSGINGMMHIRGDRVSYDAWETAGATGWNYDALLPFFKRTERSHDGDSSYRGVDGPMEIAHLDATEPLWVACYEAALEAGHARNDDNNGAVADGVSWIESNIVDGARQSAADAYLTPAASRANLTIVAGAHAQRLLIDRSTCRGVEHIVNGHVRSSFADREVILSAGAIGTPQLLLLSGIGPGQHLRDLGLDVVADVPGVGANLHDHLKAEVAYTGTRPSRTTRYSRKPVVLTRTTPSAPLDMQMIFLDFPMHPRFRPGPEDGYSVIFGLMTPASRGSVRLASVDPAQPPLIDPNYLSEESDRRRMVAGLRLAREVGAAGALAPWREKELFPGSGAQTDDALTAHLRRSVSTYYHPVGTCKIGTDAMSVVDPQLRVRNITNLRVADASVMPSIVSGNTNAPVLAIAERAASLVIGEPTADRSGINTATARA